MYMYVCTPVCTRVCPSTVCAHVATHVCILHVCHVCVQDLVQVVRCTMDRTSAVHAEVQ